MNVSPAYPLPEVVDQSRRKRWLIEQSGNISPRAELSHGVLIVPLDGSDQSRFMRDHELGHVHWSPKRPDQQAIKNRVSPDVLAAVEDTAAASVVDRWQSVPSYPSWPWWCGANRWQWFHAAGKRRYPEDPECGSRMHGRSLFRKYP